MKMKIRDFIHEDTDIDVCDDYTEECYIAFCGPMYLTRVGEMEFADALDLEVEIKPCSSLVTILVDDPDEAKAERNLKAVTHLFYAMAGFDATVDEYELWFMDEEEHEQQEKDRAHSERMALLGRIIEVFEDFLDEKGIRIPNEDRPDDPDAANIYGMDYGWLSNEIEELLINEGLLEQEGE